MSEDDKVSYVIDKPLLVMFMGSDQDVICHIHDVDGINHEVWGMMISNVVRQVAKTFNVPEEDVWQWVDLERKEKLVPVVTLS